jgi:protein-tyrosine phosphatase
MHVDLLDIFFLCSVTVVVAYLMKTQGLTVNGALEKVRLVRPEACPNFGFLFQLREFEEKLKKQEAV